MHGPESRRPNVLPLSRVRPYRTRLRDAMRRAKRGAEAPGQTDGRTSVPGKSWPAQTHLRVNDRAWPRLCEVRDTLMHRGVRADRQRLFETCTYERSDKA